MWIGPGTSSVRLYTRILSSGQYHRSPACVLVLPASQVRPLFYPTAKAVGRSRFVPVHRLFLVLPIHPNPKPSIPSPRLSNTTTPIINPLIHRISLQAPSHIAASSLSYRNHLITASLPTSSLRVDLPFGLTIRDPLLSRTASASQAIITYTGGSYPPSNDVTDMVRNDNYYQSRRDLDKDAPTTFRYCCPLQQLRRYWPSRQGNGTTEPATTARASGCQLVRILFVGRSPLSPSSRKAHLTYRLCKLQARLRRTYLLAILKGPSWLTSCLQTMLQQRLKHASQDALLSSRPPRPLCICYDVLGG